MNPIASQLVVQEELRLRLAQAERRRATAPDPFDAEPHATGLHARLAEFVTAIRTRRTSRRRVPTGVARGA